MAKKISQEINDVWKYYDAATDTYRIDVETAMAAGMPSKTWPGLSSWATTATAPPSITPYPAGVSPMLAIKANMQLFVVFNKMKDPVGLAVASTIGALHDVETGDDISEFIGAGYTTEPFSLSNLAKRIREESKE